MSEAIEFERGFVIGEWTVEPTLGRITGEQGPRPVGAKVLRVLTALAQRPGEMVSKDELVAQAWGCGAASDESLTTVIYELRRVLGDDARSPRYVGTIRGRGYRLLVTPASLPRPPVGAPAFSEAAPLAAPVEALTDRGRSASMPTASMPTASMPTASMPTASMPTVSMPTGSPWGDFRSAALLAAGIVAVLVGLSFGGSAVDFLWTSLGADEGAAVAAASAGAAATSGAAADSSSLRSVAVLELEPRGEDPSFFARGLSEHLAIDLARSDWLEVVPAFSRAHGDGAAPRLVSRDVDAVVEGAVRRLGERLWVTVQLVAIDGQLLWGGSWERTAEDLPALEMELSAEISRRVRARLGASARIAGAPEVEEALRLGRHFLDASQPREARRFFTFALERQPTSAPAHVGLAESLLAEAERQPRTERQTTVAEAKRAAETALVIEADLPGAHASLGTIALVHEGDWATAGAHFERVDVGGGSPIFSRRGYAAYLSAAGRHDDAIEVLRPTLHHTPSSVSARLDLVRAFYLARRYDDALAELESLQLLAPGDPNAALLRSEVFLVQGELDAAVKACRDAVALAGGLEDVAASIEAVFEEAGLAGVVRCLQRVDPEGLATVYDPLDLARLEAVRGDGAAALALLEQARRDRDFDLIWLGVDPAFSGLHGLEGFAQLVSSPGADADPLQVL
ncbi:MAG: winged helix-turn-helix domain-containing protein [Acidobacteriota bacterium]